MKTRPTIADLARTANVSVATVNRILAGSASVRPRTIEKVERAAEQIGFYGLGVIEDRLRRALQATDSVFCSSSRAGIFINFSDRRSSKRHRDGSMRRLSP